MQTSAAGRIRRMRARRRAQQSAPILYTREDWRLFVNPHAPAGRITAEKDGVQTPTVTRPREVRPRQHIAEYSSPPPAELKRL